jgi:uncharacterized Rmd1/YagE family protein
MRCFAYCTANTYTIKPLFQFLKEQYHAVLYRDVIHVTLPDPLRTADIFYFPYGATVFWGLTEQEEQIFLDLVKPFEFSPCKLESDQFLFAFGEAAKISKDNIVLPNKEVITRLAFSHGLAQSVKLSAFEVAVQKTFDNMQYIPEDLAKRGRIPLSRKQIRRKMGELFLERTSINLHFEVLDTPEFFWDQPEIEPYYKMTANDLEIATRVGVLNQKLDVMHELFDMLGNELHNQYSGRLEWTIICLIVVEVLLSIYEISIH